METMPLNGHYFYFIDREIQDNVRAAQDGAGQGGVLIDIITQSGGVNQCVIYLVLQ